MEDNKPHYVPSYAVFTPDPTQPASPEAQWLRKWMDLDEEAKETLERYDKATAKLRKEHGIE